MDEKKLPTIEDPDFILVPRNYYRPDIYIPGNLNRCENPRSVIQLALGLFRTHPFVSDKELASTICTYLSEAIGGRTIIRDGICDIKFK